MTPIAFLEDFAAGCTTKSARLSCSRFRNRGRTDNAISIHTLIIPQLRGYSKHSNTGAWVARVAWFLGWEMSGFQVFLLDKGFQCNCGFQHIVEKGA